MAFKLKTPKFSDKVIMLAQTRLLLVLAHYAPLIKEELSPQKTLVAQELTQHKDIEWFLMLIMELTIKQQTLCLSHLLEGNGLHLIELEA